MEDLFKLLPKTSFYKRAMVVLMQEAALCDRSLYLSMTCFLSEATCRYCCEYCSKHEETDGSNTQILLCGNHQDLKPKHGLTLQYTQHDSEINEGKATYNAQEIGPTRPRQPL